MHFSKNCVDWCFAALVADAGQSRHNVAAEMDGLTATRMIRAGEALGLQYTQVTDLGFVRIKGLTNLEELKLSGRQITGAVLEHLEGLTRLRFLVLANTRVDDERLEYLKGLRNLRSLFLRQTQATDEGVKKLQEALPNCKIYHKPMSRPR